MDRKFPKELLEKSSVERADYFAAHRIAHPKLIRTYKAVLEAIEDARDGSIITVLGPTGVGKTTLLERIRQKAIAEFHKKSLENSASAGHVPIVMVEAVSASSGFDWKDYYRRLLVELYDPIPGRKLDYRNWESLPGEVSEIIKSDKAVSTTVYRRAVEQALIHRKPRGVLIDEGQHVGATGSGRKTLDQLNHIKSIANMSKTVHVLCGSYELLSFLNLSGQLSRRGSEIHFERYRLDDAEEAGIFRNVLWELQNHLPLKESPDLLTDWEYFYERTVGCIGILHDWLLKALKKALRENLETLTEEILAQTALSVAKCQTIFEEISTGESILNDKEVSRNAFRQKLGLDIFESGDNATRTVQPRKNKTKVGVRNPARDPIGRQAVG